MSDDRENDARSACGCGGGSCCRGTGKWIWVILILAVAGILAAKTAGRKEAAVVPAQQSAVPRLVDLGGASCTVCKMMAPILEDLKATYAGSLDVQFLDVWEHPEAGEKYGLKLIPTQIFFAPDGQELFRHEGFFSKEDILTKWKEFGFELKPAATNAMTAGTEG